LETANSRLVKIDSFIRFVLSAAHALPVFEDLGFSACARLLHSALTSRVILVLSLGAIHNHSLGPFGKAILYSDSVIVFTPPGQMTPTLIPPGRSSRSKGLRKPGLGKLCHAINGFYTILHRTRRRQPLRRSSKSYRKPGPASLDLAAYRQFIDGLEPA
jgi:hypothetical protein